MAETTQSYQNHKRFYPMWHFFVFPLLVVNLVVQIVILARAPSLVAAWNAAFALALIGVAFTARYMSLVLQNRLIRLEERLRLARLLPPELQERAAGLRTRQLVALRFASDSELPELVRRCVDGELESPDQIKQSVLQWREDTLRV